MFKVGDKVAWESQAAASWTVKRGKVVAVVPAGILPRDTDFGKAEKRTSRWGYANYFLGHKVKFDSVIPRNHKSYLVEVPGGKTAKAMPRLYWPHASKLKLEVKDG